MGLTNDTRRSRVGCATAEIPLLMDGSDMKIPLYRAGWAESRKTRSFQSAAHADFAEAEDHAAACRGPAEIQLRPEAGEYQYLVNLVPNRRIAGTRKNRVTRDLALRVERRLDEQHPSAGIIAAADDARHRKWRETLQTSRLNQIRRKVIGNVADGNSDEQILNHEYEHERRRQKTARGGHGQRSQDIFEEDPCPCAKPMRIFLLHLDPGSLHPN